MKKIRKLMSALLAMSMVFAMLAVNASAATHNDESEAYPVKVRVLTQEETDTMSSLALSKYVTGTAYLPKNVAGVNGNPCAPFVAEGTEVTFYITNAPGATSYNVQLYAGEPGRGYRVATYTPRIPINNGAAFSNLMVGQKYYFMISSDDLISAGCTAYYKYRQN